MASHLTSTLKRLRLRDKLAMIFKLFSILGSAWRYFDNYLVTPVAKPAFILGLFYAIINWKVLPFAWHLRVFNGYYLHYLPNAHRPPLPPATASTKSTTGMTQNSHNNIINKKLTIFLPTLYKTSVPPGEIDFSFHKSNSTYLTDLDIARGYHLYTVLRRGFYLWPRRTGSTSSPQRAQGQNVVTMLGGTTCTFKREIKPLAKVEIWTRILSWDEKWIYLVSWFAKPGAGGTTGTRAGTKEGTKQKSGEINPDVYATCVSKVVLKEGRKTVKPEEFFRLCGLMGNPEEDKGDWDWGEINKAIEERRVEGMKLAGHVASLDEGHGLFGGYGAEGEGVLGVY
ncbi:hypothetical protein V8F20_012544 [Naviculisporaceae sp. PSN 640]